MRTNIVLDDKLVRQAFQYAGVTTKRELIDLALKEFVANHSRRDIRELRGTVKISENYDYKSLRRSE
jgi:Arc/MetJ family transcription regulator